MSLKIKMKHRKLSPKNGFELASDVVVKNKKVYISNAQTLHDYADSRINKSDKRFYLQRLKKENIFG